ncbi:3728_t:CDS:2 [Ambispora leptoticha]|uniref:3728_t:CDS:1 n=1 Tax=Ambispora leptoticha TaxID=144679 RepID=A0A9N8ZWG0_9GLOM|nr:3728_t:CDS:2 [Ambispora leptoticha]
MSPHPHQQHEFPNLINQIKEQVPIENVGLPNIEKPSLPPLALPTLPIDENMDSASKMREKEPVKLLRPLPNIQTYVNVEFRYTIQVTKDYFEFQSGQQPSQLHFTASFSPQSSSKWVRFDSPTREFSGRPLPDSARNTTVNLNIEDPGRGTVETSMQILVSDLPSRVNNHNGLSRKQIVLVAIIPSLLGLSVLGIIGFLIFRKWNNRREHEAALKRALQNSRTINWHHVIQTTTTMTTTNLHKSLIERRREYIDTYNSNTNADQSEIDSIRSDVATKSTCTRRTSSPSSSYSEGSYDSFHKNRKQHEYTDHSIGRSILSRSAPLHLPSDVITTMGGSGHLHGDQSRSSSYSSIPEEEKQNALTKDILEELFPKSLERNYNLELKEYPNKSSSMKTFKICRTPSPNATCITMIKAEIGVPFQHHVTLSKTTCARKKDYIVVTAPNYQQLPPWLHFKKIEMVIWGIPTIDNKGRTHVQIYEYCGDEENGVQLPDAKMASGLGIKWPREIHEDDWKLLEEFVVVVQDEDELEENSG